MAIPSARMTNWSTMSSAAPSAVIRCRNAKISSTTSGARPERSLIDQHQPRVAHISRGHREHLLLATAERAGELSQPFVEDREG